MNEEVDVIPAVLPDNPLRSGEEVVQSLRKNIGLLRDLADSSYHVALLVDADIREIRDRQLFSTVWGYTSFRQFCFDQLGVSDLWMRNRIDRAYRSQELMTTSARPPKPITTIKRPPPVRRGRVMPSKAPEVTPIRPRATKAARVPDPVDLDLEPEEEEHPVIGWLCVTLLDLSPDKVLELATERQMDQLLNWVERFVYLGRRERFCEHHPDARLPDGKCSTCHVQVTKPYVP